MVFKAKNYLHIIEEARFERVIVHELNGAISRYLSDMGLNFCIIQSKMSGGQVRFEKNEGGIVDPEERVRDCIFDLMEFER